LLSNAAQCAFCYIVAGVLNPLCASHQLGHLSERLSLRVNVATLQSEGLACSLRSMHESC